MFSDILPTLKITDQVRQLSNITSDQVKALLQKSTWTPNDFPALISPAAKIHLETMAQHAHRLTVQRFGKTIQLFIPMYLSNLCYNTCTYCGFSIHNKYKRIVLTPEQILNEGHLLRNKGFRHILLLTGEAEDRAGVDYIAQAVRILSPVMSSIGIEVQPMTAENYEKLIAAGTDSLTL
ncbi:radical SAM protein, partial [bacterium]|nr:radical SAM protein [bacterium]